MQSTKHTIQNLLVNEKSVFVVVYTKKKTIIILDNQEELEW